MTKYKNAAGDISFDDGGHFAGYAATFNDVPDSYGDVIAEGAFAETLKEWDAKREKGLYIPVLYGHKTDDPFYNIGRVTVAREDEHGLWVEGDFDADNEKAQYVRKLAKEGRLYQFSFAYDVLDYERRDDSDGLTLRKLTLFEVSLVQIPANQNAEVVEVKGGEPQADSGEHPGLVNASMIGAFADAAAAKQAEKAGRRNSKADADELKSILEHISAIQSIVNGLLADEQENEDPKDGAEAKAEEPDTANAEERKAKSAEIQALLQQADEILEEGN